MFSRALKTCCLKSKEEQGIHTEVLKTLRWHPQNAEVFPNPVAVQKGGVMKQKPFVTVF